MSALDQLSGYQSTVNQAFRVSRDWYEEQLKTVRSVSLRALLNQTVSELKKAENRVNQYYEDVKRSLGSFEERKGASSERLKELEKMLADFISKYPETNSKAAQLANYEGTRSMLESLIKVEQGLLKTFEGQGQRIVDHIQSDTPENVATNVSRSSAIDLDYITAERIANVTKNAIAAAAEAIPGVGLINFIYDSKKEFTTPVQNISQADLLLVWLEERIEKLKSVQHSWNFPVNY